MLVGRGSREELGPGLHLLYPPGFRQMMFSETQRSDDIKKRGRVSLSVRESQKKGAPVPRQLRTHHQNNYASTFIPF